MVDTTSNNNKPLKESTVKPPPQASQTRPLPFNPPRPTGK